LATERGLKQAALDIVITKNYTTVKQREARMRTLSLRKSGGSLIMTIPQAYTEQNDIKAGAEMAVEIIGDSLIIKPVRQRKYTLDQILAETPAGLHHQQDWLEKKPVGHELW
jgi:antitoxin component of MazEF toxin-antitoxin module